MSVVNYSVTESTDQRWGIMRAGEVYPIGIEFPDHRALMRCYFGDRAAFDAAIGDEALDSGSLSYNAPIARDVQLYCQGLNYADHRAESGVSDKGDEENLIFMKAASSICGPNDTIVRPKGCQLLDYEIELGLVLRRDISEPTRITEQQLADYVGGLVLCNDVSARDLMFGAPMLQWFRGKSQRTFCPTGPVLYLLDGEDLAQLYSLELKLKMNGELKQDAVTSQLIHRPAQTLSEISGFADLREGDCLLTGTPGGILAGASPKAALAILLNFTNDAKRRDKFTRAQLAKSKFLEPGDVLELQIRTADGSIDLGTQTNQIADA
jgi:2-keto-4-pentenoate hydratase/2-oxohepta-3-ene-1,7-dioic acid hydratase in catechol pathway